MEAVDILILSNGPGELTTWVRPVVKALRQQLGNDRAQVRISVVLSPCSNATGKEAQIAQNYPEVDRVQAAEHFFGFLLRGETRQKWDWRSRGVVLFLGGDQIFPLIIGKHLAYRTVIYAEWEARWYRWIDRFGIMKPEVADRVPPKYASKLTVVGDLMAEAQEGSESVNCQLSTVNCQLSEELIGLLPGSKAAKLSQGLPLGLAIAEKVSAVRPQTRFAIPVAPTIDLETLAGFADPEENPVIPLVEGTTAELVIPDDPQQRPFLKTPTGLEVELYKDFPAHNLLSRCCLCLTTVGANTADLGSLAVPMIILLPTNQLEAMRAWDGLPGLLANLPGVGTGFAKIINWLAWQFLRNKKFSWPNIWAKEEIVPELVGILQPQAIAEMVLDFLNHPEKLEEMRSRLREVRGEPGAAHKLAQLVAEELAVEP